MGLCQRCKKAQATFHLTNIDPQGTKTEHHLCERCAIEEGLQQAKPPVSVNEYVETFLASSKAVATAASNLVCENCGITYIEFRNQGMLGCPDDYDAFKEHLSKLIERAQENATHHVGKTPKTPAVRKAGPAEVRRLKKLLEEAVAAEDYERAAQLRDRIGELEKS